MTEALAFAIALCLFKAFWPDIASRPLASMFWSLSGLALCAELVRRLGGLPS